MTPIVLLLLKLNTKENEGFTSLFAFASSAPHRYQHNLLILIPE
jgi:hypothetical protein